MNLKLRLFRVVAIPVLLLLFLIFLLGQVADEGMDWIARLDKRLQGPRYVAPRT